MTMRTALCRGAALGALLALRRRAGRRQRRDQASPSPGRRGRRRSGGEERCRAAEGRGRVAGGLEAAARAPTPSRPRRRCSSCRASWPTPTTAPRAPSSRSPRRSRPSPATVDAAVASHAPKTDKIYYKGITLTLGGFAAAEGVYRSKNNVADIGSNYSKIPYDNNVLAHTDELRGTARQSRISFLAQGNINPNTVGRVLRRVRLPGRRPDRQLEREQLLQPAHPQRLRHARLERLGLAPAGRPELVAGDA